MQKSDYQEQDDQQGDYLQQDGDFQQGDDDQQVYEQEGQGGDQQYQEMDEEGFYQQSGEEQGVQDEEGGKFGNEDLEAMEEDDDQRYDYDNIGKEGEQQIGEEQQEDLIREGSVEIEPENEEDRQFIDDADADDGDSQGDQDPIDFNEYQEAEEDTGKKKTRKNQLSEDEIRRHVTGFISRMEFAWQQDREAFDNKKPALQKLRMLGDLEEILANRQLHRPFLQAGILGTLKAWMDLLPDYSMPNIKIRSTVFRILRLLPIDTSNESDKNRLINSQLGRVVMFYYRCKDESLENRRVAKQLIEQFLRPVFLQDQFNPQLEEANERQNEYIGYRRQRAIQEQDMLKAEQKDLQIQQGQEGFRYHARVPQQAKLDYVLRPDTYQIAAAHMINATQNKQGSKNKLQNKIRKISATSGKTLGTVGAAHVSLSEKNIGA